MRNETFLLRNASMDDASILLEWRNDQITRLNSHDTNEVSDITHRRWLDKMLADESSIVLIGEYAGIPVGTARATLDRNAWSLSWTVAPVYRNRGIGTRLVSGILKRLDKPARAEIRTHNRSSSRIAVKCGMVFVYSSDQTDLYWWNPSLPGWFPAGHADWIPTSTVLPAAGRSVRFYVSATEREYVGTYLPNGNSTLCAPMWTVSASAHTVTGVSHWMPLGRSPKATKVMRFETEDEFNPP